MFHTICTFYIFFSKTLFTKSAVHTLRSGVQKPSQCITQFSLEVLIWLCLEKVSYLSLLYNKMLVFFSIMYEETPSKFLWFDSLIRMKNRIDIESLRDIHMSGPTLRRLFINVLLWKQSLCKCLFPPYVIMHLRSKRGIF